MENSKNLFLLDAYALIYRGYYAFIKNPRINSKGPRSVMTISSEKPRIVIKMGVGGGLIPPDAHKKRTKISAIFTK